MRIFILIGLFLSLSGTVFAGANVKLNVSDITNVKFSDRASNHPSYFEIKVRGKVTRSDASVDGLPDPLPQSIRLLFKITDSIHVLTYQACISSIKISQSKNKSFTVNLFMGDPNNLVEKIEGGMSDSQFNQFVIKADDNDFSTIGCEY